MDPVEIRIERTWVGKRHRNPCLIKIGYARKEAVLSPLFLNPSHNTDYNARIRPYINFATRIGWRSVSPARRRCEKIAQIGGVDAQTGSGITVKTDPGADILQFEGSSTFGFGTHLWKPLRITIEDDPNHLPMLDFAYGEASIVV